MKKIFLLLTVIIGLTITSCTNSSQSSTKTFTEDRQSISNEGYSKIERLNENGEIVETYYGDVVQFSTSYVRFFEKNSGKKMYFLNLHCIITKP
jgi:hypothetical protein